MNLFVRDLTVIDASYLCEQRGMVGESWILDVSLTGQLNEMNMVLDFGLVKKKIKKIVDECVDHKLLIPLKNKQIFFEKPRNGYSTVDLLRDEKGIHLHCPDEAFCGIDVESITPECVIKYINNVLKDHLPDNVTGLELNLRSENIDGAHYHYSHGLKKHDGNCQRIAHGHRSPIELFVDGIRNATLEAKLASRWNDIYLGSTKDLTVLSNLTLSSHATQLTDESHYAFRYTAPQGEFELAIPKSESEVLSSDTTIELLASYIADEVKQELRADQTLKVVAYEGVGKGAMAFR